MTRLHCSRSARGTSAVLAVALLASLFASPALAQTAPDAPMPSELPPASSSDATIQVMNAVDGVSVDVYLNGIRVAASVDGFTATETFAVRTDEAVVRVVKSGSESELAAYAFALEAEKAYHIVYTDHVTTPLFAESVAPSAVVVASEYVPEGRVGFSYYNDTETAHALVLDGNELFASVSPAAFAPSAVVSPEVTQLSLNEASFAIPFGEFDGETLLLIAVGSESAKAVYVVRDSGETFTVLLSPEAAKSAASEQLEASVSSRGVQPNPFAGSTALAFDVAERAVVQVEVFDTLGRLVERVEVGTVEVGAHRVPLTLGSLAPGTYAYRLSAQTASGTAVTTGRMTALR
jgi:hypothetical protein